MKLQITPIFVLFHNVGLIYSCASTSATTTTTTSSITTSTASTTSSAATTSTVSTDSTTSTSSTTSTTTTSTTSTTTMSCTTCDPAIVVPMTDPNTPGSFPPTTALGAPQAGTGCATLDVTCTSNSTPPGVTLLTFFAAADGSDLGNAATGDPTATGSLVCNMAGEWIYTGDDGTGNTFSVAVGSASCIG